MKASAIASVPAIRLRKACRFSHLDSVGCDPSGCPASRSRPKSSNCAGSCRNAGASLPSLYLQAMVYMRCRTRSNCECCTRLGSRASGSASASAFVMPS